MAGTDRQLVIAGGGQHRYAFEADELPALKTRFDAWVAEREAAAKARAEAEKAASTPAEEPEPAKPLRGRMTAAA